MNAKKKTAVLLCLLLTGCSRTVPQTEQKKAELYYQYLPVAQRVSGSEGLSAEQLEQLDTAFQERYDAYEQTMYHIVGESSYMNPIQYVFQDSLTPLQNYSPMAAVLYQHREEIAMNPILLLRHTIEGDGDPLTEYDSYTEHISRVEKEQKSNQILEQNWQSPELTYSGTAELFLKNKVQQFHPEAGTIQAGRENDMYYIYLIEFHEDIECYAYYFYISQEGICYQASVDYLLYGGNELASCFLAEASLAGEGYLDEKLPLLQEVLDIAPSEESSGAYQGYDLCESGFVRDYISDMDGKIARLEHHTYLMQKPQE